MTTEVGTTTYTATKVVLSADLFQREFSTIAGFMFSVWAMIFKFMLIWAIIIAALGLIGFIIYLVVSRKDKTELSNSNNANMEPVQQPVFATPAPQLKTSGFAIASLVLGIVSLIPQPMLGIPCGILALIFGLIARSKIKQGLMGGRGLSTAGITLGTIGVVLSILVISFFAYIFANFAKSFSAANMSPQQYALPSSTGNSGQR